MECRKRSLTYSAPIFVDIKYTLGDKIMMKRNLRIGQLPIMLHSSKCVLRNKTPAELAKMQECLYDPGGYFIVRGAEKVLLMQEQMSKNRLLLDINDDGTIVVRCRAWAQSLGERHQLHDGAQESLLRAGEEGAALPEAQRVHEGHSDLRGVPLHGHRERPGDHGPRS